MSYPFIPFPTLSELEEQLKRFDVKKSRLVLRHVKCAIPLVGEFYHRRLPDGPTKRTPVPPLQESDHVTPSVLRSICRNLGIDPAELGLPLG